MFNISVDSTKSDTISELDRRLKNPFWSGFALAWITWNWRVWYITFFVSETLTGNKIVEIQRMYEYFGLHALPGILLNWIIIPIFISFCITFYLPKLTNEFLRKQKKNKDIEDGILRANIKSEEENIKAEVTLINAEREKLEAERERFEAEKKKIRLQIESEMKDRNESSINKEWDKDLSILLKSYKNLLNELTSLIYNYNGYANGYGNPEYKKLFEVNNLVIRTKGKNDNLYYELSEKGKYFLRKGTLSESS